MAAVVFGLSSHAEAARYPLLDFPQLRGVVARDVLQDSFGSIWLATDDGLWRWASEEFVAEGHRFPTHNPAECLLENAGVLWVGTGDGLVGVDLASMAPLPGPPELRGLVVHHMVRDASRRVWCATSGGLYRLRVDAPSPTAVVVSGTRARDIYSVVTDSRDRLWAGAPGILLCYNGRTLSEHFEEALAGGEVRGLTIGPQGALWIGLRNPGGLYKLEGETLTRVLPRSGEEPPEVNVIIPHPDGEVWIGTERGVLRWTGSGFIRIDRDTGLARDAVHGLYVDREELAWIATRGGVYQLRSPYILTIKVYDGLPHPVVQTVLPRPNGDFIVGTAAGLCRMDATGRVIQRFRYLGSIEALYADELGCLWVGGRDGLACFDELRGERLGVPDSPALRNVSAIGPHHPSGIQVCTATGLWCVDGDRVTRIFPSAESAERGIGLNGMYVGPHGTVYLATQTGIHLQGKDGEWKEIATGRPVYCLASDARGRLWVGTSQGLMTLEGAYCRDFVRRGSPYGKVTDIAVDHHGALWMATPEGVCHFDGRRFTTYDKADGCPCEEVHCVKALRLGVLLVGTSRGLAFIESDRISPSRAPPRVAISGFKAGGEPYAITNVSLRVPNWQRNVSISFQSIGFRQHPKGLRYMSRLVGFQDEDWSAPSPEPGRDYTNLPWGDYEFQVKAVNAQGMWSDQIASVEFSVGPPLWLDPWFVVGCTIVLTSLGAWVIASQRKKRQLQRAAEAATIAKSEFLARVSHEIRTPLTVILGCSEGLAAPQDAPGGTSEAIDAIRRNSNHLLRLINDLLDFSKIEAGHLTVELAPASVPEVLRGVEAIMRVGAERHGLDFRILCETDIPEQIITDPGRLQQALINLVGNAIKFTPAGHIHIRVRVEDDELGRRLVFDVEDTGIGVPREKTDLIFDAFGQVESSTARKFTGTGLGLAISKSVAEQLHGGLTVRSEVGKGSTFTLWIDLSRAGVETRGLETRMVSAADLGADRPATVGADARWQRKPAMPALSGHILLAEDAPDISNIMRLQLESAGAQVTVADDGTDAVERAYDGRFDAIIMDIHMPGMDGIAAIKELRGRGVETPIIVISADSSEERYRQCRGAGADGFVPKPFEKAAFLEEIGRHLAAPAHAGTDEMADPIRCELDLSSPKMAAAVAEFARSFEQRLVTMETALQSDDVETIAWLAHQLKGAGGINGYMCVSQKAEQLEESLARDDRAAVQADLEELRRITERVLAGLSLDGIATGPASPD